MENIIENFKNTFGQEFKIFTAYVIKYVFFVNINRVFFNHKTNI